MKKGFTLVELIAVIVIISILLGITAPTLVNKLASDKQKAKDELISSLEMAAKGYATDNDLSYPTTVLMTDLCGEYFDCPVTDPVDDSTLDGSITIDANGIATFNES